MGWPFVTPAAPNVDPEITDVPTGSVQLEASDVWLLGYCFVNTSGAARQITVTNAAGTPILSNVDVPENGVPMVDGFSFLRVAGLKWQASGAGVKGKLWGYK